MEIRLLVSLAFMLASGNIALGTSSPAETPRSNSPSSNSPSLMARLARKASLFLLSKSDSSADDLKTPRTADLEIRLKGKMWSAIENRDATEFARMFGYERNPHSFDPLYLPMVQFKEIKPDINSKKDGITPLMYVVKEADWLFVRTILDMGGDPNMANDAETLKPLNVAIDSNKHEIVRMLLAGKADPNSAPRNGYLPLWHALRKSNYAVCIIAPHVRTDILKKFIIDLWPKHEESGSLSLYFDIKEMHKAVKARANAIHEDSSSDNKEEEFEVLPELEAPDGVIVLNGNRSSRNSSDSEEKALVDNKPLPQESRPKQKAQQLPKVANPTQGKKAKLAAKQNGAGRSKAHPNGKLPPIAKTNGKPT